MTATDTPPRCAPATAGPAVQPTECLYCYVERMVNVHGCSGKPRWVSAWCAAQRTNTSWVGGYLRRHGGYCDCEVLVNVFGSDRRTARDRDVQCDGAYDDLAYNERSYVGDD